MRRLFCLLILAGFVFTGCATFHGMHEGFKEDTHSVFNKAHHDIMKLDHKIRDKAW